MVSSFTANKSLEKPANGDDVDTWNVPVNADWDAIDASLGGVTSLNVTSVSATPVVLTVTQYRPPIVEIAGALTANVTYQFPSGVGGFWSVFNNSTGAFTITFASLGGGTSYVIPQGYTKALICDGTNVGLSTTPGPRNYIYLTPSNPASTTSTTPVMMGLGSSWALTLSASGSGRVSLSLDAGAINSIGENGVVFQISYGTGTAPANGSAAVGTVVPNTIGQIWNSSGGLQQAFHRACEVSLTPGTTCWFDLQVYANVGGTASIIGIILKAQEETN